MSPRRTRQPNMRGFYYRINAKGRKVYEFTYLDSHKKRHWVGRFELLGDAEKAHDDIRHRLHKGHKIAPTKAKFAEYVTTWMSQQNCAPKARRTWDYAIRCYLIPALGDLKPADISPDHVAQLITDMRNQGRSANTIRIVLCPLRGCMNRAVRNGILGQNPVSALERGERPKGQSNRKRPLTGAEVDALLAATSCERDHALFATLIYTGARISEALAVRWADVDFDRHRIHLPGTKTRQADRTVDVMASLIATLRVYRMSARYSADTDPVFADERGGPITAPNARYRILKPTADRAGLNAPGHPAFRFHDCRHTFATLMISARPPLDLTY
jgi:integrase